MTDFRVGIGFDAHPLTPGRRLVLGGVDIPYELGLSGHSDGDVLVHAMLDALLGAAGLGVAKAGVVERLFGGSGDWSCLRARGPIWRSTA